MAELVENEIKPDLKWDVIAQRTKQEFDDAALAKQSQEKIFVRAHFNTIGRYQGENTDTVSAAFVQVTRPRVQTAQAMLVPILMPPGGPAWVVDCSPEPDFPGRDMMVRDMLAQDVPEEEIHKQVLIKAQYAADRLALKVNDGLAEANTRAKYQRLVLDAGIYGAGCAIGPFVEEKKAKSITPEWQPVSPFDLYPDPSGRSVEECSYVIHRSMMSAVQLRKLRKKPGFDAAAIDEVLATSDGNYTPQWWEQQVDLANGKNTSYSYKGRYEILVRYGWISGRDLKDQGHDIPDDMLEDQTMMIVWTCGHKVISIRPSKLHADRIPVYIVPYQIKPLSPWGVGIPEMMFDSQDGVNACERAKYDNMALCSGPQMIVDPSRIHTDQTPIEQAARKIWAIKTSEVNNMGDPVRFESIDCRFDQIQLVQDKALALSQEQTAIPNMLMGMGGDGVHNRTAEGATLQYNTAITPLKSVVSNFEDHFVIPFITSVANLYRMFDSDPTIVGDTKIIATGLQGLMEREALSADLLQFAQIAGSNQVWSEKTDIGRIFDLMVRSKGLASKGITIPAEVIAQQKMLEQQAKNQDELALEQEKARNEQKTRAETAPRDAMMEAMKNAPDNSMLKIELNKMLMADCGLMTPELLKAYEIEEAKLHINNDAMARKLGSEVAALGGNDEGMDYEAPEENGGSEGTGAEGGMRSGED